MMGRLTKRAGGTVVYAGGYKQYEGGDIPAEVSPQGVRELLVRLAEYEDTGMAPEDVCTAHEMAQIYSLVEENKAYRAMGIRLDRLEEIASDLEKNCSHSSSDTLSGRNKNTGGKTMKKLFISQPMRGKTDEEILAVRAQAKHEVEASLMEKVVVIDSFIQGAPADAKPLWYLGKSLELLSTADIAYFAKGWEEARGCRIEHECAEEYGGIWIVTYETI
jgi:hypothetical protein